MCSFMALWGKTSVDPSIGHCIGGNEAWSMCEDKRHLTILHFTVGYLHAPHDGLYAMAATTGDHNMIMLAADGNPDNMVSKRIAK